MTTTPPTPEDFEAMSAAEFDAYLVRNGMDDRIKAAMREPMTTTPGPLIDREALLAAIKAIPSPEIGGIAYRESHLLALIAEQPVIEAEARADVDGLVARLLAIIEKGANWMAAGSRPTVSNATDDPYTLWLIEVHAVIPAARALLAGNKAEFGTDAHDLPFDGDKADD